MSEAVRIIRDKLQATRLPSLPHVLLELLAACQNEDVRFEQLTRILERDTALAARVVAIANSAAYGPPRRFSSFERTLVVLGVDTIKTIAITASVYQVFSQFRGIKSTDLKRFWQHPLACATVSRMLARVIGYGSPDEAYLSGLLHDVGKLILWVSFHEEYQEILNQAQSGGSLVELERRRFGTDHSEVGAWLVDQWPLQSFMGDAVRYHHEPLGDVVDAHHLVKIVYLANLLASEVDEGTRCEAADRLFGLTGGVVADLLAHAKGQVEQTALSMGIRFDADLLEGEGYRWPDLDLDEHDLREGTQLARKVRDVALLGGVHQHLACADSEEATLSAVERSVTVLFGVQNLLLFLYDRSQDRLVGKSLRESDALSNQFQIPLQEGRSLIADALLSGVPLHSFSNDSTTPSTVIDRQVIRLLQRDGIMCLPLQSNGARVGALVMGIDRSILAFMLQQMELIKAFSNEAALAINDCRVRQEREKYIASEGRTFLETKAQQIAHEVKNPLSIMKNYLQVLSSKLGAEHPATDELRTIREEIDRVGEIILRLSHLGEEEAPVGPVPVDVNGMISELLKVFEGSLFVSHDIRTQVALDGAMPPIVTKRNTLKQVLINLIKNAVEAMPEHGELRIATQDYVYLDGREYVEITVSDNGPGIPPHILAHLFEPVSSTKGVGHSGLGLSIVKNLVDELKGSIRCRSNERAGTLFDILLPRRLEC